MIDGTILALDLGSTAVKAGRYREDGSRVGDVVRIRHRAADSTPGHLDADVLLAAAREALESFDPTGIRAVSTSTVWHALVALDTAGDPLGRALTWEANYTESLRGDLERRLTDVWSHETSGAYIHPSYGTVAMPILAARGPASISDLGSWVVSQLGGFRASWPENIAAGSGCWLQREREWNTPALAALAVDGLVPQTPWIEAIGATRSHGPKGALWLPPVGDGLCHNLGQRALDGRIALTVGTSGSVRAVGAADDFGGPGNGLWRYRCDETTTATGGAVTSAGNTLEWVAGLLGPIPWESFSPEMIRQMPRADASVFGRRGPDYPWNASGSISGLRPGHDAGSIALAVGTDVWTLFAEHLRALGSLLNIDGVVAEGGVLEHNPAALQVLVDVLGVPVSRTHESQPSLAGAALVGATALHTGTSDIDATVERIRVGAFGDVELAGPTHPRDEMVRAMSERASSVGSR